MRTMTDRIDVGPGACARCDAAAERNLCAACADDLDAPLAMVPEQLLSACVRPLDAALVDRWGRAHRLAATTLIGRVPQATGVAILTGVVSRRHAELRRDRAGAWWVRDLGSANGTFVDERRIDGEASLAHGARLTFGSVGVYFVFDRGRLRDRVEAGAAVTVRPDAQRPAVAAPIDDFDAEEPTFAGMPSVALTFVEAPSGGGGYLAAGGNQVRLTDTQFAMVLTMAQRMAAEATVAPVVRGFVPSGQLIADLPWDAHDPDEGHLKQLVRRTRKALEAAHLGDLIESRRGFGYRLRVMPAPGSTGL